MGGGGDGVPSSGPPSPVLTSVTRDGPVCQRLPQRELARVREQVAGVERLHGPGVIAVDFPECRDLLGR